MAEYIQLPSGAYLELKKGQTPLQGMMAARQLYPDAFKTEEDKPKQDTTGGKAAAAAGFERLKGEAALTAGKLGLMDEAEAEKYQKEREAAAKARFTPTEKGWTEDPLLKFRETLGGSLPYMALPAAAGLTALAAPVSAPVAAGLGLLGAGAVSTGQFTGSNLAAQLETGKTLEQASGTAAFAAAIPQALVDTAAMALLPGVGKLFSSVGSKLTTAEAKAIAEQTFRKAAADYTAKTGVAMGREGFTETVQQVLERLQAGTSLTDADARKEYIDSFIGGAVLGGAVAPAGRYIERSAAKSQAAKADREEKLKATADLTEQERVAAEQEAAQRQTPEYALKVVSDLQKLEQEKLGLQKQIRKITKDSTTEAEDKAFNKEINAQLRANEAARSEIAAEVSRVKQSGLYQQAVEQERISKLTPEEYALEGLENARDRAPARQRGTWKTEESEFAPAPRQSSAERLQNEKDQFELGQIANLRSYVQERMELAREQVTLPNAQEYAEYLAQDPAKALALLQKRVNLPGLNSKQSAEIYKALREVPALQAYRDQQAAANAQRVADVQAQLQTGEIDNEQANAYLEQLDIAAQDRSTGRTQRDIEAVEKQAAMTTATTTQGELFGGAEERVNMPQRGTPVDIDAQIAELERQLDVAKSYGAPDSATRPKDREGRRANRERISTLMEAIQDLKDRQAKIAAGTPMGEVSTTAVGEAFGSELPAQEKAAQARRNALEKFTTSDYLLRNGVGDTAEADVEAAKQGVVDALLKEISEVRGKLKPETITEIEKQVRQLLDNRMLFGQDYVPFLNEISARWRAGVRRGSYGATQPTPTETSADMLLTQMDRAFAQRQRYDAETLSILDQIAENFKAFTSDPERRNMAGEWLNRVTQTGRASPEMTRDVRNELARLEEGKRSETETPTRETAFGTATKPTQTAIQGELDADLMPEAVAPQSETRVVNGKVQYVAPEDIGPLQGSAAERYAPMQKGTIFATQKEFDEYLASDYLKEARENQGLARETVSRLSKQVAEYEAKMADTQKQIDALQERKAALQNMQVTERRAADQIVADTEVQLQELLQQMADDLGPIRMSLEQAEKNLAAAEARSEETSRLIANNIANFTQMDDKVVRAAEETAAAKAELRKARNKLGSLEEKRPGIEAAQRKVIEALQRQRNPVLYEMQEEMQELQVKLSKARVTQPRTVARLEKEIAELEAQMDVQRDNPYVPSSAMITFLNNDLQLQMDAVQDRAKIGAAKRSVGHFTQKLAKASADLNVDISTHPEVKALREQISVGKTLGTDALRGIKGEIKSLDAEIEKLQNKKSAEQRQVDNIEDQIIEASEARTFAGQLAGIAPETMSALDRAETLAKDKKKLEDFQARTERLNKLPGQRIDFSQRQEMLELVNASTEDFAQLDAAIEDMRDGVEFLAEREGFLNGVLADLQTKAKKFRGAQKRSNDAKIVNDQIEEVQTKLAENTKRIQTLRDAITQYEKTRVTKQAAVAKAEKATSSDPEIAQEVTKSLDARIAKLEKTISGKEAAVVKGNEAILKMARDIKAKADEGKTSPAKLATMRARLKVLRASQADRKKHLKEYVKERDVLQARRSNRLGITRTDVLTGEKVAGGKAKKATIAEQEQFDAEVERTQEFGREKDRLANMEAQLKAMKAAKQPRGKAKQEERAEKIRELQEKVNTQKDVVARLTPAEVGAVSQATKIESSAPGKFRTGTPETKAQSGSVRRPIVETRTARPVTSAKAIADANAFAERLLAAKTPAALDAEFAAKEIETQNQIIEAVESNISRLQTAANALANELFELNQIPANQLTLKGQERKEKVRKELLSAEKMLDGALRDRARLLDVQTKTETAEEETAALAPDESTGGIETEAVSSTPFNTFKTDSRSAQEDREDDRFLRGVETESVELDKTTVSLLKQNDIRNALTRVGNDPRVDDFSRTIAKLLKTFLDQTDVKLVANLSDGEGNEVLGAATSQLIELNTDGGLSVETLLHEGTHAAAERIIKLEEKNPNLLTREQRLAINELKAIHARIKNDPGITSKNAKGSLSEFVAEVMSNRNLQKQLAQRKWKLSNMWVGIKSVIMRMLGVQNVETMFGASAVAIEQLFVPSSVRNIGGKAAPETRVTRNLSAKDIAALHDGSNSMKQFADQFGNLIKQKDRTPEDVERIASGVIGNMLSSVWEDPSKSVVAAPTADSLDYKSMLVMSDGKTYNPDNPLHYVEAEPATFAALAALKNSNLREREAKEIFNRRRRDFNTLGEYLFRYYDNYTTAEIALVLKAAAKYGVISDRSGKLKLVEIGKDNRHNIAVVGKEGADAVIEQLRAGKNLKQAFLDGLQKNADDNAKNNERKNGWKKFEQSDKEQSAIDLNAGCAGTPWCTGGDVNTARNHIENGDFYVYYKNGRPEVAVRMDNTNEIGEVRGNNPDQELNLEQQKIAEAFLNSSDFDNASEYLSEFARREKLIKVAKGETEIDVVDLLAGPNLITVTASEEAAAFRELLKFPILDGYNARSKPSPEVAKFFKQQYLAAAKRAYENNQFVFSEVAVTQDSLSAPVTVKFDRKTYKAPLTELKAVGSFSWDVESKKPSLVTLPKITNVNKIYHFSGALSMPALKTLNEITFFATFKTGFTHVALINLPADARVGEVHGYGKAAYGEIYGAQAIDLVVPVRDRNGLTLLLPDTKYVAINPDDVDADLHFFEDARAAAEALFTDAGFNPNTIKRIQVTKDDNTGNGDTGLIALYSEEEFNEAFNRTGYSGHEFATDDELIERLIADGVLEDRRSQKTVKVSQKKINAYEKFKNETYDKLFNGLKETFGNAVYDRVLKHDAVLRKSYEEKRLFKSAIGSFVRSVLEVSKYSSDAKEKLGKLLTSVTGTDVSYAVGVVDAPKRIGNRPPVAKFTEAPEQRLFAPKTVGGKQSGGAPANALEALAQDITARPKTLKEKLGNNLALQLEMQGVDMRAGLRDVLKFGDDTLFTQAMYHVRKAEQKMAQMFAVMNNGPLEQYTDAKGLVGYRSSNKNSARDVFDAIVDIPVDNPQLKTDIAQAYMVAQRAQNKGLSKLDLGELGITEEKLKAALAAANADPTLKAALENVRRKYNAYNKGMIEFLASTGRISKKVAADLLKDGDYVPYYRVRENGTAELNFGNNVTFNVGDIRRQPYLAELKGGETKLLPLNEAIQQNTLLLTDMALTNNAAKSVAYGLQALGKGMGPVDPATGKRKNLMPIKTGLGPADARTIRFYQEPDPSNPKDTGERHIVVDTKGTLAEGVPAELVVQSLEGSSLALPGFFKLGGVAADLLRAGVTRTPLYIARKLLREPMAASFTGGLNSNVFSSVFKAGAEFLRMSRGTSDAQAKLIEKGLIQSNIFAGDMSDMKKMALQLASGKDQGVFEKVLAAADRYAMRADASTLALVLKNAEANGLSEVEADMATMESMNFYKRGLSPTLQYASRLIPFFNAQIQGLNVLVKAARGNMPFEERQEIKRKFFNNALLLTATGLVYAMAMEDDETFRNARPRDKYSNFFLPIPGVDEPLKMPIPFEAGYFYSLAVAAVDGMRAETDGKAQWSAIKDLFLNSIPGYSSMGMPQIIKPAFEVWTNKNFLTGGPIETLRMENLTTEQRYLATTTELAKLMSKAVPILSPVQIEHLVRGYLGVLPLAAAAGANSLFESEGKGERPEGRASDLPLIGSAFQKKYGGGDAEVVFRDAKEAEQVRNTLNDMLKSGRRQDAAEFREAHRAELALAPIAGQYRQVVGRINQDIRRTQERDDLTAQEKRVRLDALEKAKQDRADAFLKAQRMIEDRVEGGRT